MQSDAKTGGSGVVENSGRFTPDPRQPALPSGRLPATDVYGTEHTDDATAEFYGTLNDPTKWVIKKGVPIFKPHVRTDPATGSVIKVDLPKLYRIADNMQRLERQGGVPIRMTLGHTEPGKPETEQPPVGGYYRNARVARFGPKGEPAVVVDEWLDPQYQGVRKNFPYRSAEYYDDAEQITGVALLTRDPYLDLGVVAYSRASGVASYTRASRGPVHYSANGRPRIVYDVLTAGGENAMWPEQNPYGAYQGPAVPGTYPTAPAPAPAPAATPVYAGPTPYAGSPSNPTRYDTAFQWPVVPPMGTGHAGWDHNNPHTRANIGHPHPMGGAIYDHRGGYPGGYPYGHAMEHHGHRGTQHPHPGHQNRNPHFHTGHGGNRGSTYGMYGPYPYDDADPAAEAMAGGMTGSPAMPPGQAMCPPMPGMGMPGMAGAGLPGAGPTDDALLATHAALGQAVEHMSRYLSGRTRHSQYGAQAPTSPFPYADPPTPPYVPQHGTDAFNRFVTGQTPAPTPDPNRHDTGFGPSRTVDPRDSRLYVPRAPYAAYSAAPPMTTISGLPVGYQMKVDALQYELRRANEALKTLFYERDQADTQWCIAEIRRLAEAGYPVGEYELTELKAKPRQHREAYLYHVTTKYAAVPTSMPPPLLGDPTPGMVENPNRPATQEEMEAAVRLTGNSTDPNVYAQALNYVRNGGQAPGGPSFGPAFGAPPAQPFDPAAAAWNPGAPAPQSHGFVDPYAEPSANGSY